MNTLLCVTEPRVPLRSNLDDPEDRELPVLLTKVYVGTKYIARNLLLVVLSSSVERRGALGTVLSLRWNMGTQLGRSQPRARFVGKHSRVLKSLSQTLRLRLGKIKCGQQLEANVLPSEQSTPSRDVVKVAVLEDASVPWEPGEPAVISCFPSPFVGGTAPSTCPLKNVTNTPELSRELHGTMTATRTAHRMSSAQTVSFVPSGVELVSRATYISRRKRNRETCWRQSKALKRVQREAKRKLVAQPEISHEAAEAILRSQAPARSVTRPRERVVLHTMRCCQRWWITEASEVSVRRLWRISPESET